ncbi:hypothetical protein ColLi_11805 [Colletotrichum liriopes]|uniref:Uncharacterized protein n=1 Tax=Colletotrichum liriopes TaxID=708192 RepID=A0AA37GZ39_9PEZI|nr:hypothetical protein ColLi_11805 [Colletotrichum liriopes]
MNRTSLLLLLLCGLVALVSADSPTFCKCTCFKNSTIVALGPQHQDGKSGTAPPAATPPPPTSMAAPRPRPAPSAQRRSASAAALTSAAMPPRRTSRPCASSATATRTESSSGLHTGHRGSAGLGRAQEGQRIARGEACGRSRQGGDWEGGLQPAGAPTPN